MDIIQRFLLAFPGLLLALCVHEFAHAWVAVREGDRTPEIDGRLTLDPRAHLDPIGSLLFPAIAVFSNIPLIGWAKPVMTNPRNYRDYKWGDIRVSLAGVAANLILAIILGIVVGALLPFHDPATTSGSLNVLTYILQYAVLINVMLMFFNLIPVPPLDGSHVLAHFLSPAAALKFRELERYGFLILYAMLFLGLFRYLMPVVGGLTAMLIRIPYAVIHG